MLYTIERQGAPLVNSAWVRRKSRSIVCIEFDLASKYCSIDLVSTGMVCMCAGEHALKLSPDHDRSAPTVVKFTGRYASWDVFAVSSGRYTIGVCLMKPETKFERWLTDLKYAYWGVEAKVLRWLGMEE